MTQAGVAARLRRDAPLLLLAFAAAFVLRLTHAGGAPNGDEAAHYYIARHWGQAPDHVDYVYDGYPYDLAPTLWYLKLDAIFWQRPAFFLLLAPGAMMDFDAFRLLHVGLASLMAPLVFLVVRAHDARRAFAGAAATAVAVHPILVSFGAIAFPDTLMATAFAAALWMRAEKRPLAATVLLGVAVLAKEFALFGVLYWLLVDLVRGRRAGDTNLWPLRLNRYQSGALVVLGGGLLPFVASYYRGGLFPGWGRGGDVLAIVDHAAFAPWFYLLFGLGLVWPRTRALAGFALALPLAYVTYRLATGHGLAIWHLPFPMMAAAIALGLVLDEWTTRARPEPRAWRRAVPIVVALMAASIVVVDTTVAGSGDVKRPLTAPFSHWTTASLEESIDANRVRDQDLLRVAEAVRGRELLLVDVGWFYVLHPFSEESPRVRYVVTEWVLAAQQDLEPLVDAIESNATTVLLIQNNPLNGALRGAYADCTRFQDGSYVVFEAAACRGRLAEVKAAVGAA